MKVTVAIDNNVPFNNRLPLVAEHGASFLIEIAGKRILYDTGQTGAVVRNLVTLGVDPNSLDGLALSHGHYDHTGGLLAVLNATRRDIPVTIHARAFTQRFSVTPKSRRAIGIPFAPDYIRNIGGTWTLTEAATEIAPGLWFSGSIPRERAFEPGDPRLVVEGPSGDVHDPLPDDSVLYWAGREGLVVIGGCTHSGLVNAVRYGFVVTGADRLQGWIGGTHLGPATAEQQDRSIAQLVAWQPDFVAANHCTGFPVMCRLQQTFGERFIPAFVGQSVSAE